MSSQMMLHEMGAQASHVRRLREAERAYRVNAALDEREGTGAGVAGARQAIGTGLVLAGEWLRGTPRATAPLSAPSLVR